MGIQPFTGVTVLQFGQFVAVPYASQMLADGGAHIIKIEPYFPENFIIRFKNLTNCSSIERY